MNCQRAEGLFSAYREEELPLNEKNSLAQHLESCASCKREYKEFVHTLDLIHSLPRLEAPTDFTDEVLARVRSGAPAIQSDPWWQRAVWSVTDWADSLSLKPAYAAAAAVLVIAVVSFGVIRMLDQGGEEPSGVKTTGEMAVAPEAPPGDASETPAEQEAVPTEEEGAATDMAARGDQRPPAPSEVPGPAIVPRDETVSPDAEQRGAGQYAVDNERYPVVPDSLFDHEYDFEFALDRFYFEGLPDESGAEKMHPLPATKGRPASITF